MQDEKNDSVEVETAEPEESVVLEPEAVDDEEVEEEQPEKLSWWRRFFAWLANLFNRLAGNDLATNP